MRLLTFEVTGFFQTIRTWNKKITLRTDGLKVFLVKQRFLKWLESCFVFTLHFLVKVPLEINSQISALHLMISETGMVDSLFFFHILR